MLSSINTMAGDREAAEAELVSRVPLGRLGTPDDVANVVTWLLSTEASYVTGAVYLVDAGVMS
jgi:meso-butanediol dehydrogenase/(S,S)-butanediol dehydrogenase/diacetyl reductase